MKRQLAICVLLGACDRPAEKLTTEAYVWQRRTQGDSVRFLLRDDIWPWLDPGKKVSTGWLLPRDESAKIDWQFPR